MGTMTEPTSHTWSSLLFRPSMGQTRCQRWSEDWTGWCFGYQSYRPRTRENMSVDRNSFQTCARVFNVIPEVGEFERVREWRTELGRGRDSNHKGHEQEGEQTGELVKRWTGENDASRRLSVYRATWRTALASVFIEVLAENEYLSLAKVTSSWSGCKLTHEAKWKQTYKRVRYEERRWDW